MKSCPHFECLSFSAERCAQFPGCMRCEQYCSCTSCTKQTTLVSGSPLPCDLKELPTACRFCSLREKPDFSPEETCPACKKIGSH